MAGHAVVAVGHRHARQLAAVWKHYGIGVSVTTKTLAGVTVRNIVHTEAAYLIDARVTSGRSSSGPSAPPTSKPRSAGVELGVVLIVRAELLGRSVDELVRFRIFEHHTLEHRAHRRDPSHNVGVVVVQHSVADTDFSHGRSCHAPPTTTTAGTT